MTYIPIPHKQEQEKSYDETESRMSEYYAGLKYPLSEVTKGGKHK